VRVRFVRLVLGCALGNFVPQVFLGLCWRNVGAKGLDVSEPPLDALAVSSAQPPAPDAPADPSPPPSAKAFEDVIVKAPVLQIIIMASPTLF